MKLGDVIPFVVIVALGEVHSVLIQWMNDSPKPNLQSVLNKKDQFTLSNAFSASSDMTMALLCEFCHMLIKWKSLRILSEPCRFLMKPV